MTHSLVLTKRRDLTLTESLIQNNKATFGCLKRSLTIFFVKCSFDPWFADKSLADQSDRISDSSGVGTSHSGSAGSNDITPTDASLTLCLYPEGVTVVCTEAYGTQLEGHLNLQPGDIIEGIKIFWFFLF